MLHCGEDILRCIFTSPSRFPLYPLYPQTGGNCGGTETSLGSNYLRSQRPPADTGNQPKASSTEFLGPCWPDRGRGFARKPIVRVSHGTAGCDFGRAAADAAMKAGSSSMAYSRAFGRRSKVEERPSPRGLAEPKTGQFRCPMRRTAFGQTGERTSN